MVDLVDWPTEIPYEFLRPLTAGWIGKLDAAERSRSNWKELADECRMFYNRSAAAMWSPGYARKFWRGVKPPRFRITLNLAYEYVAVQGPHLMWDVPHRQVTPKRFLDMPAEIMGGEQSPLFALYQREQQQNTVIDQAVSFFLEDWLNYCATEQRNGGLGEQSHLALVDALLTGRGCVWSRPYRMPGSERTLIGSFREPPESLLIDPDFTNIHEAKWIALKHTSTYWELERRFQLPPGTLKSRATLESSWSYGEHFGNPYASMHRVAGSTNDMIVWWEIWSKTGVGGRLTGMHDGIRNHLENVVGDYAYLAVSAAVPYPLNCTTEQLRAGLTPEQVKQKFSWPSPLWSDGRWPVQCLDFYPNTDPQDSSAAWPIPPLAPGMGEMKFLNFLIPWLANRTWSSSRDFWAIAGAHVDHYKKHLQEGEDQTILPTPTIVDDVRKAVQVLQQPNVREDSWRIIELVTELWRYRVGLLEYAYGGNVGGTQSRTAEDALAKREAVGARPAQMQKQVVSWQSTIAAVEAFLTRWFVSGEDVQSRYGSVGRMLWERFIMSTDIERVVRQMGYSISASSIRRPNRDRDLANFLQSQQHWLAVLQQYASQTGDYSPLNGMFEMWGELHDMDVSPMLIPPPQPQDDSAEQMQMAQMQAELEGKELDLTGKQMDIQGKQIDVAGKVVGAQAKAIDAVAKSEQADLNTVSKLLDIRSKSLLGNGRPQPTRRAG